MIVGASWELSLEMPEGAQTQGSKRAKLDNMVLAPYWAEIENKENK
jgi:hypothetical protein